MQGEKRGETQPDEPGIASWGLAMWFTRLVPEQKLMKYRPSWGWAPADPPAPAWVQGRALRGLLHRVSHVILTRPTEV